MYYSPLDQFMVKPLLMMSESLTVSMTNYTLYLMLVVTLMVITYGLVRSGKLVSTRWGVAIISLYDTMLNLVTGQMGRRAGYYYPLVYTVFNVMLLANLVSMVPYSFAATGQLVPVIGLSLATWMGNVVLGLYLHGLGFFATFVPGGTPTPTVPVLVTIECTSYCSRAISTGTRLGANILSGHTTMTILGGTIIGTMSSSIFGFITGVVPIAGVVAITITEFGIAIIQAYVFSITTSGYIKDSVDTH
uniref:ATP synthase subunit a n=1 Tax=Candida verbasci TaxID=1227364 RepID=A0A977LLT1_9ASCO|nr:ATP synthase F0 subunit a [Candida verbasci]UXG56607.1 ATP synthase F0 subunit a [Candida verbasci]